jgi:hypothetical protein
MPPLCLPPGAVVLVERGNCSFVAKYQSVLAAGGKAMLVFNNEPGALGGVGGGRLRRPVEGGKGGSRVQSSMQDLGASRARVAAQKG